MNKCALKEKLHSAVIGSGLAVVLLAFCWGAAMITWVTNENIQPYASNRTDQHLMEHSVILADADASSPHGH